MLSLISLCLLAISSIVLLSYCLSLLLLWRLLLFPWFILLYPWSSLLFLWRYWCVLHCIVCVHVVCCAIEFLLQLLGFHCCSSDYYLYHCHTWFDCFLIDVDAYFFGFACDFFDMPAVLLMILRFIWIHCHFIDCYSHFIDAHCYVMLFYCCIYDFYWDCMYLFTIPGFFLCTSLMCLASLSFLIAMSLMFIAVSLISMFITKSLCSAMISLIFSVVYLIYIYIFQKSVGALTLNIPKYTSSYFKRQEVWEISL